MTALPWRENKRRFGLLLQAHETGGFTAETLEDFYAGDPRGLQAHREWSEHMTANPPEPAAPVAHPGVTSAAVDSGELVPAPPAQEELSLGEEDSDDLEGF